MQCKLSCMIVLKFTLIASFCRVQMSFRPKRWCAPILHCVQMTKHRTTYLANAASLAVSMFVSNVHAMNIVPFPHFFSLQFILLSCRLVNVRLLKIARSLLGAHGLNGRPGQSAASLVQRGDRVECVTASLRARVYLTALESELKSESAMNTPVLVRMI